MIGDVYDENEDDYNECDEDDACMIDVDDGGFGNKHEADGAAGV